MSLLVQETAPRREAFKTWLRRGAVALVFLYFGMLKFGDNRMWVQIFDRIGFGQWFRYFTGVLQVGGALLVLIPGTTAIGTLILSCTMLGAVLSWVLVLGDPMAAILPGALLGGLLFAGGEELIDLADSLRRPRGSQKR